MSLEQNKSIVRRWIENGWNQHNVPLIDELYMPNVVQHDGSVPDSVTSATALKQYVGGFLNGFSDMHFTIDDLMAEGDKVLWRFEARATHDGELMGIPPTGRQATVTGMALFRLKNSKIAEVWVNFDALGMMQQLGVIPAHG